MREGVAASKLVENEDEQSNVIPFPERSVDYTGSALKLMAGLAKSVNDLRSALDDREKRRLKPQIRQLIERIIETMDVIQEHMDVLDEHSDVIKDFIEPGNDVYFSSEANRIPLEIISLIERRNTTLMVRRFFFRGGRDDLPTLEHDNDRQTLLTYGGRVACKWPRTP